ncbi:quinohemoprotein amine dehydrogenase, alpha subunit [Bacillus sp. OxB-1]|uniref:quinohemoprotein amine dehydrogenase subunit alpha n=1 Tax=Bacillus sp. (strain OxB-1) TaxID=98228 RepID=UPI0005820422|nr:quinohemoprotein amine dehydrogenase subunit alpha [Bacillus sp. OxB-1]BAQ11975.1 quinohemoprotein amine dehydrogenase, alpha subunit [Bacillus sp. OxB-1]
MIQHKRKSIGVILLFLATLVMVAACTKEEPQKITEDEEANAPGVSLANEEWSDTFKQSCITCHAVGEDGKVDRISDVRKTPEGWQDTITRMQTAWGVQVTDEEKAAIVQELSDKNGLAPKETEKVMYWLTESGSTIEPVTEEYDKIEGSCIACHAGGRPLAQYRTEAEWMKLKDFHIGMSPAMIYQMRTMKWEEEAEEVLAYMASIHPYDSEDWEEWKDKKTDYEITGTWRIVGHQPGSGIYSGYADISEKEDMYFEKRTMLMPDEQEKKSEGNVRKYAGYSLRSSLTDGEVKTRGVFNVIEDGNKIEGRWNQVNDKGIFADETYYKADKTALIATWPSSIKSGTTETIRVIGSKLPDQLTPDSFVASEGLVVDKVEKQNGDDVWITVTAQGTGEITLDLKDGEQPVKIIAFDKVDSIKVLPERGLARLNYTDYLQSVQFEAIGYTADNQEIGPLNVKWELHEDKEGNDELKYVGQINTQTGLFTPAQGGPNPERVWTTNNTGYVTAKAIYQDPATQDKLTGESKLFVTLPDYVYIK